MLVDLGYQPVQVFWVSPVSSGIREWRFAEHIEHGYTECPDIAWRTSLLDGNVLWWYVPRRSTRRRAILGLRRQAEVAEDGTSLPAVENVAWLDVVVDKSPGMDVLQGACDVVQDAQSVLSIPREHIAGNAPSSPRSKVASVDMFHIQRQIARVTTIKTNNAPVLEVFLVLKLP